MALRIVAVGKLKQPAARALVDEYLGRLQRYVRTEEVELRAAAPAKQVAAFDKACGGYHMVALDVKGTSMTSESMASRLERLMSRGKGDIALLIGGADGLPPSLLQRALERWSLSQLTLPHRLARVLLAEQLYRSMTILRHEPYNH